VYHGIHVLSLVKNNASGLKITAGQCTMSGQDDNFSGQTTSFLLVISFDRSLTIYTSPIIHLVCPPKFCVGVVLNFSWDDSMSQEKLKTMLMQGFWGQAGCIVGDVKVANASD